MNTATSVVMNPGAPSPLQTNPCPGLRPFHEDEDYVFFGRESQVDTMVDKLAATRFLAVVGTSGSGKSSLVNCGLRPALRGGLMARAGTTWRMAQFRPGSDPLRALARALAEDGVLFHGYQAGGLPLDEIVDTTLRMSKLGLIDIYEQARLGADVNLLVVVDQFEELFRYRQLGTGQPENVSGVSEAAIAFVNLLLEVKEQTTYPIYVVLTMRSDFLGDCTQFPGLAEAINAGQYLVPRMTRDERRAAITGPVGVGGAEIAPVLLTRLVNDVGDNPDQLSILQHALNRTWARWENEGGRQGPLDLPHYKAIGTMAHALDQHAERAYSEMDSVRRQQLCEKIFKALTDKATDPRGVRRPTTLGALCALADATQAEVTAVIDVFRKPSRSFVMPPAGEALETATVIDISHESLMRVWQRLNTWADAEAQAAQTYRRLADTAALHAAGKAGLWRSPDLQLALDWQHQSQPNETWASRYHRGFASAMRFLTQSSEAYEAERAAREEQHRRQLEAEQEKVKAHARYARRIRWAAWFMGALAVVALVFFVRAYKAEQQANNERDRSRSAEQLANNERDRSRSKELAARAQTEIDKNPALAVRLAREGLHRQDTSEARSALLHAAQYAWPAAVLGKDQLGGAPRAIALSSDGSRLAVLADDQIVTLWDVTRQMPMMVWPERGSLTDVKSLAFSPDLNLLAVGRDASVDLLNMRSGKLVNSLDQSGKVGRRIVFSHPDGQWLASVDNDQIWLWDYRAEGSPITIPARELAEIAVLADGEVIVGVGSREGTLFAHRFKRLPDGTWPPTPVDFTDCTRPQSVSPSPRYISVTSQAFTCIYRASEYEAPGYRVQRDDRPIHDLVWSASGGAFAQFLTSQDLIVAVGNPRDVHWESHIKGANPSGGDPDKTRLISMSEDGARVALIDAHEQVKLYSLADHKPFLSRLGRLDAVAPDGTWMAVVRPPAPGKQAAAIDVIPIELGSAPDSAARIRKTIKVYEKIEKMYVTLSSVVAVLRTESETTRVFDASTGKQRFDLQFVDVQPLGADRELLLIQPTNGQPWRLVKTQDGTELAPWGQSSVTGPPLSFKVSESKETLAVLRVQASNPEQLDASVYSVRGDRLVPMGQVLSLPAAMHSEFEVADDARSIREARPAQSGKPAEHMVWSVVNAHEPARGEPAPLHASPAVVASPQRRFEIQVVAGENSTAGTLTLIRRRDNFTLRVFSSTLEDSRFSSDDRWFVVKDGEGIQVFDLERGQPVLDLRSLNVEEVEFEARNTILKVLLSDNGAMFVPLDYELMKRFAEWLVPPQPWTLNERCLYGLEEGGKDCRQAVIDPRAQTVSSGKPAGGGSP